MESQIIIVNEHFKHTILYALMFQLQNTWLEMLSIIQSSSSRHAEPLTGFYPQCTATPHIHLPHCDARLWCLLLNIDRHLVFHSSPIKNEALCENPPSFSLAFLDESESLGFAINQHTGYNILLPSLPRINALKACYFGMSLDAY